MTSERSNGPNNLLFNARDSVVDAGGDPRFSSGGSGASTDAGEMFRESIAMDSDIINAEEVCLLSAWRNPCSASVLVAGGSSCASSCALEAQEEYRATGVLCSGWQDG